MPGKATTVIETVCGTGANLQGVQCLLHVSGPGPGSLQFFVDLGQAALQRIGRGGGVHQGVRVMLAAPWLRLTRASVTPPSVQATRHQDYPQIFRSEVTRVEWVAYPMRATS